MKTVLTALGSLSLMVAVFVGAYYASKLVGGSYARGQGFGGGKVEVLDKTVMGRNEALVIVRVAGKVLLLGVTAQQITKVEELDPSLFPSAEAAPPVQTPHFLAVLTRAIELQREAKRNKGDTKRP